MPTITPDLTYTECAAWEAFRACLREPTLSAAEGFDSWSRMTDVMLDLPGEAAVLVAITPSLGHPDMIRASIEMVRETTDQPWQTATIEVKWGDFSWDFRVELEGEQYEVKSTDRSV